MLGHGARPDQRQRVARLLRVGAVGKPADHVEGDGDGAPAAVADRDSPAGPGRDDGKVDGCTPAVRERGRLAGRGAIAPSPTVPASSAPLVRTRTSTAPMPLFGSPACPLSVTAGDAPALTGSDTAWRPARPTKRPADFFRGGRVENQPVTWRVTFVVRFAPFQSRTLPPTTGTIANADAGPPAPTSVGSRGR